MFNLNYLLITIYNYLEYSNLLSFDFEPSTNVNPINLNLENINLFESKTKVLEEYNLYICLSNTENFHYINFSVNNYQNVKTDLNVNLKKYLNASIYILTTKVFEFKISLDERNETLMNLSIKNIIDIYLKFYFYYKDKILSVNNCININLISLNFLVKKMNYLKIPIRSATICLPKIFMLDSYNHYDIKIITCEVYGLSNIRMFFNVELNYTNFSILNIFYFNDKSKDLCTIKTEISSEFYKLKLNNNTDIIEKHRYLLRKIFNITKNQKKTTIKNSSKDMIMPYI